MSGAPDPEAVNALRRTFQDFVATRAEIAQLETIIERDVRVMGEKRELLVKQHNSIQQMLKHMDVANPRNFGWEARFFELLAMLSEV